MAKKPGIIFRNRENIRKNITTIRCYLELNMTEFGEKAGIGKRAAEFESGRFRPKFEELEKIAALADINVQWIIEHRLYTVLNIG